MILYLCILVVLYIFYKGVKSTRYWKDRCVETAESWPFLGHMAPFVFGTQPGAYLVQDLYNKCTGRYCGMYNFTVPSLLVKDLELLKRMAIKDFEYFHDHCNFASDQLDPMFAKNLFFLEGQKWKNMRSTLSPSFTGSKMKILFLLMRECAERCNEYFLSKGEEEVEMKETFSKVANDIIASCALGVECNSLKDDKNDFFLKAKDLSNFSGLRRFLTLLGYVICPKLMEKFGIRIFDKNVTNFFHNLVMNNIETREKDGIIRKDMIHLLMEAKKGKQKFEDPSTDDDTGFATTIESTDIKCETFVVTDEDIIAQAVLFLLNGFETVSAVMSFVAYEIAVNPDVQKKLQGEIDNIKILHEPVTYEVLIKMNYLDMVISECLRKWPPNFISDRVCTKPYTIEPVNSNEKPVYLKQGDVFNFSSFAIHRDPKYFTNPDKFDPERFNDENKANIKTMSYFPFGIGLRNCIGSRFALIEIKIILYYLLSQFDLIVCEKTQIPLKITNSGCSLTPDKGIWLKVQRREQ